MNQNTKSIGGLVREITHPPKGRASLEDRLRYAPGGLQFAPVAEKYGLEGVQVYLRSAHDVAHQYPNIAPPGNNGVGNTPFVRLTFSINAEFFGREEIQAATAELVCNYGGSVGYQHARGGEDNNPYARRYRGLYAELNPGLLAKLYHALNRFLINRGLIKAFATPMLAAGILLERVSPHRHSNPIQIDAYYTDGNQGVIQFPLESVTTGARRHEVIGAIDYLARILMGFNQPARDTANYTAAAAKPAVTSA